jgi:hypothetical protein
MESAFDKNKDPSEANTATSIMVSSKKLFWSSPQHSAILRVTLLLGIALILTAGLLLARSYLKQKKEYHVVDPHTVGFTLVLKMRSMEVDSYGRMLKGEIKDATIDDFQGRLVPIELSSTTITDNKMQTTQFGTIPFSCDSGGGDLQFRMTDSQVQKVQRFLREPLIPPKKSTYAPAAMTGTAGTTIHDAAKRGDLGKIVALLQANPDLVFSKDNDGWTPLHWAVSAGHKDVVELLLNYKAEVNASANNGWTPLKLAMLRGQMDMVEKLRDRGGHE